MKSLIGWIGESIVSISLWIGLKKKIYFRHHNVIVLTGTGTTQIDHLILSCFGIFVVETKNYRGWIFGSENQAKWTQSIYGKKYSFQNPLHQNYRHVKALSDYFNLEERFFHSVIYFTGNSSFKTKMPSNVLDRGLIPFIRGFQNQGYGPETSVTDRPET
jgi:restriction system protein